MPTYEVVHSAIIEMVPKLFVYVDDVVTKIYNGDASPDFKIRIFLW